MSVVLVDSGGANIGSVRCALQRLGADATLTSDVGAIRAADKVILPGVGAAAPAMECLREHGLVDVLRGLTQPVLGVCLGMQLLCTRSDEGDVAGLGVIDTSVRRIETRDGLRVPHMGWNRVHMVASHAWLAHADDWAYFVHGYAVPVCPETLATCRYGTLFSAAIGRANFTGVQYHPERSAALGAKVLQRFLAA